jgi:hypothetical protein
MTKSEISQWHKDHPYGARDLAYIDTVLTQLRTLWLGCPHQRLGQLIVNYSKGDPFHTPDERWVFEE